MEISAVSAQDTKDEFLQLLVTQLQNQDPLEPVKQEDFLSQLAQFSSLEGIETLNSTLTQQTELQERGLRFQELTQAATMVGSTVEYAFVNDEGKTETRKGTVDSVHQEAGRIELRIGEDQVGWESVSSLSGGAAVKTTPAGTERTISTEINRPVVDQLSIFDDRSILAKNVTRTFNNTVGN